MVNPMDQMASLNQMKKESAAQGALALPPKGKGYHVQDYLGRLDCLLRYFQSGIFSEGLE